MGEDEQVPEGDSIHRMARRLNDRIAGMLIAKSEFRIAPYFETDLAGFEITEVKAVGKHFLMRMTRGQSAFTLHSTIRMDGVWNVFGEGKHPPKKVDSDVRVRLHFSNGQSLIGFRLPVVDVIETAKEDEVVGYLGPDLLGDFNIDEAVARFTEPERPIIQAILDQRNVSGIGNLWAVETCFLRGAYPWAPVRDVDLKTLLLLASKMMHFSLDKVPGMITTGNKKRGETHWVYGRYRKPCRRCNTSIEFRAAGGGPYERETWWCPHCQPHSSTFGL